MKHPRKLFTLILFSLTMVTAAMSQAQIKPAPEGVTIVIPLNTHGVSREASIKAMQSIVSLVRKQPGLLDDQLLENKNQANQPSHVHVTRWREQKNWEAVFSNQEFLKALQAHSAQVTVAGGAGIYIPLK